MVRDRGLVASPSSATSSRAWSWFGVNMLGVGLHSYGFMDAAFKWLMMSSVTSRLLRSV